MPTILTSARTKMRPEAKPAWIHAFSRLEEDAVDKKHAREAREIVAELRRQRAPSRSLAMRMQNLGMRLFDEDHLLSRMLLVRTKFIVAGRVCWHDFAPLMGYFSHETSTLRDPKLWRLRLSQIITLMMDVTSNAVIHAVGPLAIEDIHENKSRGFCTILGIALMSKDVFPCHK